MDTPTTLALALQALAGLLVGLTIYVVYRYLSIWRAGRAWVPLHVWLVAASYDLLVIAVVVQASVVIRWWHWVFYIPALLLGIPGMLALVRRHKPISNAQQGSVGSTPTDEGPTHRR